jgi:hypothetical protein
MGMNNVRTDDPGSREQGTKGKEHLMAIKGTLTLPDKQETALNTNLTGLMKW